MSNESAKTTPSAGGADADKKVTLASALSFPASDPPAIGQPTGSVPPSRVMPDTVADVMTRQPMTIEPDASVREAARKLDQLNVGLLPVCDGDRLVGVITDRDITVRVTSAGLAPDTTRVADAMTDHVHTCRPEETAYAVALRMGELQIRRLPVVDADGRLVAMLSLGDLASRGAAGVAEALERISTPAEPDRSGSLSARRAAEAHGAAALAGSPEPPTRTDDLIREDACRRLTTDPSLDASSLDVDVDTGAVILSGTVPSWDARELAERIARRVEGVRDVRNMLRIG